MKTAVKVCTCFSPRNMGYLDSLYEDICGNCELRIDRKAKAEKAKENPMTQPSKPRYYKGRGEHSVMNLEHLVEQFIDDDIEMQTKVQMLTLRVKELEAELQKQMLDENDVVTILTDKNAELTRKLAKAVEQRNDAIYKRIKHPEHIYFNDKLIDWLDAELNGDK